ncbi:MAG: hypothetical protein PWQ82_1778 [Thermosediminibacterales bacterium]|nr:hypothetical protein [Thermosediminibacterales bacterium]MDK2836354.1 hypothetical protein [Thermosediminibacterales bacterium]
MFIKDLETPNVIVDLKKLKTNIREMADIAKKHNVELWPMIKTHKSDYILNLQLKHGAKGILVAKLSEAEMMANAGAERIMIAYPIVGEKKLERLYNLSNEVKVVCSVDTFESASFLNKKALEKNTIFDCMILIDSGLKRLGISVDQVKEFYNRLKALKGIRIAGVATHGGHVYGASDFDEIKEAACEEVNCVTEAAKIIEQEGGNCEFIALGSTPTVKAINDFKKIKQIRPGNYVFYDAIQVALGVVPIERCALSVLGTVISIPEQGRAVIDVGSKVLSSDTGAHGNNRIEGYGLVKNHKSIVINGLSEELGKIYYNPEEDKLKIGQVLEIVPNHACSVVNMVNKIYGVSKNKVIKEIFVTARGLSQ